MGHGSYVEHALSRPFSPQLFAASSYDLHQTLIENAERYELCCGWRLATIRVIVYKSKAKQLNSTKQERTAFSHEMLLV
jgi:hypothetical protein